MTLRSIKHQNEEELMKQEALFIKKSTKAVSTPNEYTYDSTSIKGKKRARELDTPPSDDIDDFVLSVLAQNVAKLSSGQSKVNDLEDLHQKLDDLLHYYGPDGTIFSKKEQIEVLLRLNSLYKQEKLTYTALTHYVYYMEEDLQ